MLHRGAITACVGRFPVEFMDDFTNSNLKNPLLFSQLTINTQQINADITVGGKPRFV